MTGGIQEFKDSFPEYAKDTRINFGTVLSHEGSPGLTESQIAGIALASAYAAKSSAVVKAVRESSAGILMEQEVNAARSAASIMAMNNVYYRFVHLLEDKEYQSMPAKLRMTVIGNPGISKADFELYALAVSAVNGCGMCMDSHARQLVKAGLTKEAVQSAVRIAAVINSAAQALWITEREAA